MKKWPMPTDTVLDVIEREDGKCAVCGLRVEPQGHIHHRQPRGMGGGTGQSHALSNLLYLHPSCHLQHVERHRDKAKANGWLLEHWQSPQETPLMYMLGRWVVLTDDGLITPVRPSHEKETETET